MSYWAGLYEGEGRKALEDGVNTMLRIAIRLASKKTSGNNQLMLRMRKMTSSSTNGIELIFATVNCCSQWESNSFCGSSVIMASALSGLEMLWDRLHMGNTFAGVCFCYLLAWSKGGRKFGKVG